MSKKKTTPAPPIVLVITLEPDRKASLLTRRGDLAHLSQFTYQGLQEIVAAIQAGAAELIELEANPPTIEIVAEKTAPTPPSEVLPEIEVPSTPTEVPDANQAPSESASAADFQVIPAAQPAGSLFGPKTQQAKLF